MRKGSHPELHEVKPCSAPVTLDACAAGVDVNARAKSAKIMGLMFTFSANV